MKRWWLVVCALGVSACASVPQDNLADGYRDPASVAAAAAPASTGAPSLESPAEIEKILSETNPVLSEAGPEGRDRLARDRLRAAMLRKARWPTRIPLGLPVVPEVNRI